MFNDLTPRSSQMTPGRLPGDAQKLWKLTDDDGKLPNHTSNTPQASHTLAQCVALLGGHLILLDLGTIVIGTAMVYVYSICLLQ